MKKGEHEPRADGVLIFDEVKVVSSLLWNSRSQKIVGLAMTSKDQASLHDIYQTLDGTESTQQMSYILQFLWRDLTSSFDIVGPYFTCCGSLASKFILACVLETLQMYGFKTSILVCDGAAANLTTIKATMGVHGAFGVKQGKEDPHLVEPFFINPFNPPNKIFWIICPSHQVRICTCTVLNYLARERMLNPRKKIIVLTTVHVHHR